MKIRLIVIIAAILLLISSLCACEEKKGDDSFTYHDLSVVFINVGRADAALIKIDDYACLIDTGEAESAPGVFSVLARYEIDTLDSVIITHTHDDHMGGLENLAKNVAIKTLYSSPISQLNKNGENKVVNKANKYELTHEFLETGTTLNIAKDAYFDVLAPTVLSEDEENDNSLVLMLHVNGREFLFTGDMQFPEETKLLIASRNELKADVLKVANHGNPDATSQEFAQAVSPEFAVISTDTYIDGNSANKRVVALFNSARVLITENSTMGYCFTTDTSGKISYSDITTDGDSDAPIEITANRNSQTATLTNTSSNDIDISRYFIYSTKGAEVFRFPTGTILAANSSITIGNKDGYAFLWDEKTIWNKNDNDMAILFDNEGRLVGTYTVTAE